MPSSRFIVLKLKDIIKIALFVVVGIALLIALIVLASKGKGESVYNPGTYSSKVTFGEETLTISVFVSKNKIEAINISEPTETVAVFYPLLSTSSIAITEKVLKNQTTDIEVSSNSPVTDGIILDAINKCLSEAKK